MDYKRAVLQSPGSVLRRFPLLFPVVVCFCISSQVLGATPVGDTGYLVDQWQTEDGLPQNSVTSIAQAKSGYLWMGTFNGLVRFDGARFTVFDAGTTPELASSRIVRLVADREDRLWIISEFGDLTLMEGDRFTQLRQKLGPVHFVIEDSEGGIWLHRRDFLEQFGTSARIPLSGEDNSGYGWIRDIGFGGKKFWVNRKFGTGVSGGGSFGFSPGPFGSTNIADQIFPSSDGSLWAAVKEKGLVRYREGREVVAVALPAPKATVKMFYEDSAGNLWIGTVTDGLFRYSTNGQWLTFDTSNGLSHNSIRVVFEDHEGNVWVGTDGGGLNRLKPAGFRMRATGLGVVLSVTEDGKDRMYVALNGEGIRREENGRFKPLIFLPCFDEKTAVWSVMTDREGDVWTGDLAGGLVQVHGDSFLRYPYSAPSPPLYLRGLYQSKDGSIWAGHLQGLMRFSEGEYSRFGSANGLPAEEMRLFAEDQAGRLIVGVNGAGLARYERGRFRMFRHKDGLIDDRVWSLYADSSGVIWVGTFGSGLSRFAQDRFFNFQGALPVKVITSILEDQSGYLWLGSLKGIFRVSRAALNAFAEGGSKSLSYQFYDKSDGLSTAECSGGLQPAAFRTRGGKLLFATLKGVAEVDPARIPFNPHPPKVIVEEALIDERPYTLPANQPARVEPGRTRVEFRYTALSFTASEKVRFKYQMEGVDKEWIDAGARRTAPYMNVPPGKHQFHVIACNNDGVWNEQGAQLSVIVLPFFWQTGWFRLSSFLGTGGLVSLVFWRKIQQLKKQRQAQQDISRRLIQSQEQERKRIAGELHDSLGQNLQLIKNRLFHVKSRHDEPALNRELQEISAITAEAIDEMRAISYALRPVELEQVGLTRSIESLVQKVAEASKIRFLSEIENVDGLFWPEMEMNFYRVLQETLNNAVKHSGAAEAIVEVKRVNGNVTLSVLDDGRGIPEPAAASKLSPHFGLGMASMHERASILGGKLEVRSAPGKGTRVTLIVPLSAAAGRK